MRGSSIRGGRGTKKVPTDRKAKKTFKGPAEEEEEPRLIPGIHNDITVSVIVPMLSWKQIQTLSSVSLGWQVAIQSREVYNARTCAGSRETLAILRHYHHEHESGTNQSIHTDFGGIEALALYSIRDNYWHDLPPVPFDGGIGHRFQCAAIDGTIYIFGGLRDLYGAGSKKVYMLDLAAQGEWKECASMNQPRLHFGSGVVGGKIYVFGGCSSNELVLGCEVYDPKVDTWSQIEPMNKPKFGHVVGVVGEKLCLYGGHASTKSSVPTGRVLDAYHPAKKEWTRIELSQTVKSRDIVFMTQGKLHKMNDDESFSVYDIEKDSLTLLHSFGRVPKPYCAGAIAISAMALGDELLFANVHYTLSTWRGRNAIQQEVRVYQCRQSGSENNEMAWEKASCSGKQFGTQSPFMCPIQL